MCSVNLLIYFGTIRRPKHSQHQQPGSETSLADPGGGAQPEPSLPPNGRMIFYAQNANFSQIYLRSIRSRLILGIILIKTWPIHVKH